MRRFVGIDHGYEPVPDETTVCRFRHLLEEHVVGRRLFDEVGPHLAAKGSEGGHRHSHQASFRLC
jgi:IS5 family transposase